MKRLIAIAGLPGSGKTTFMALFDKIQCVIFNDINRNWSPNIEKAKAAFEEGKVVIVSDILFCRPQWREKLEHDIGAKAQWICFENHAGKCETNARKRNRKNLEGELAGIDTLSRTFKPFPMTIVNE